MIRFAEPWWLASFLLLPLALGFVLWANRRRHHLLRRFAHVDRLRELAPASLGRGSRSAHTWLLWVSVVACGFALARPQFGFRTEVTRSRGIDLVVALDLSRSMLAEDIRPSRLARAKAEIRELVDRLEGHRVGLVGYTTVGLPLSPLTVDGRHVRLQLERIQPETLPQGGTSLAAGIEGGLDLLETVEGSDRAIVVFTDGEDHAGSGAAAAARAAEAGVTVHVVGLGGRDGEPIPRLDRGRRAGFVRDRQGRTVLSRLDEEGLRRVAESGRGVAALPSESGSLSLDALTRRIDAMTAAESEQRTRRVHIERYRWGLWPATVLLFASFLIRPSAVAGLVVLATMLPGSAAAQTLPRRPVPESQAAVQALNAGDAVGAARAFDHAIERLGDRPELRLGRGLARAKQEDTEGALADLEMAERMAATASLRAAAAYAAGNVLRRAGRWDEAIGAYRRSLLADPSRDDARTNLELTRALADRPPESPPEPEGSGDQEGEDGASEPGDEGDDEGSDSSSSDADPDDDGAPKPKGSDPDPAGTEDGDSSPNSAEPDGAHSDEAQPDGAEPDRAPPDGAEPDASDAVPSPPPDTRSGPSPNGEAGDRPADGRGAGRGEAPMDADTARAILEALRRQEEAGQRQRMLRRLQKAPPVEKDW
jgi:Ca-activated chloride channel family protein